MEKKPSYRELDDIPPSKMDQMIQEGTLDRKYCMGYLEHRQKAIFANLTTKDKADGKEYNYPSLVFGQWAYHHVLEDDLSYNEAMEVAAKCLGKDAEWIQEVKHKRFNHSKEVYEMHKEHPVQKAIQSSGHLDKATLTNSRSVTQLVKRLSFYKGIHEEIEALKENATKLRMDLDVNEVRVDHLYKAINTDLPPSEQAGLLKEKGWKVKDIAEKLGVSRKTVSRWLK
jgi:AraC-like DNA-binding protein